MAGIPSHISKVVAESGKKGLFSMIFSFEGLKMLADGNVG
jgi:hypothetical protein